MLEMRVSRLTADPITNMPILVLSDAAGREQMSIWIGLVEASAIASELEKIPLQRPMTHDLMKTLLGACEAKVARVEIRDVRESTFYAAIVVERAGLAPFEVDARPSDAIALALRAGAPIRVARKVIEKSRRAARRDEAAEACGGEADPTVVYRELLESLPDEEFGKWKM